MSDAAPAPFGSWSRLYALVLGALALQVIVYHALSRVLG